MTKIRWMRVVGDRFVDGAPVRCVCVSKHTGYFQRQK